MLRLDSLKGRQMGSAEQRIFCIHGKSHLGLFDP
jgi:hypothetical protein